MSYRTALSSSTYSVSASRTSHVPFIAVDDAGGIGSTPPNASDTSSSTTTHAVPGRSTFLTNGLPPILAVVILTLIGALILMFAMRKYRRRQAAARLLQAQSIPPAKPRLWEVHLDSRAAKDPIDMDLKVMTPLSATTFAGSSKSDAYDASDDTSSRTRKSLGSIISKVSSDESTTSDKGSETGAARLQVAVVIVMPARGDRSACAGRGMSENEEQNLGDYRFAA